MIDIIVRLFFAVVGTAVLLLVMIRVSMLMVMAMVATVTTVAVMIVIMVTMAAAVMEMLSSFVHSAFASFLLYVEACWGWLKVPFV